MLLITGCTISQYNHDYKLNIDKLLQSEHNLHNMVGTGYKYYLPRGVRLEYSIDYNKILYTNGIRYYLYIDVISFYHQINKPYEINTDAYYSRILDYNDRTGYIEINKINQNYLIEMMYNYGKIEAYVDHHDINKVVTDFCYILSSIKFNKDIIETIIGSNTLDFNEEKFNIFVPTRKEHNFLDHLREYDNPDPKEEIPNNDIIEFENITD
jgi:hypothetical protein